MPSSARDLLHFVAIGLVLLAITLAVVRLSDSGPDTVVVEPGGPASVLLVSIDSLRSDHLHAYGYERETSPTIDRLAQEGVLFETVISSSSWTLPAHITLLTSMPPEQHGVMDSYKSLDLAALTLAEVFKQAGYNTAAFVSGPYLRSVYGYSQGFERYDESAVAGGHLASHRGSTSPELVVQVNGFLDEWDATGRRQPFFIFLHMWDVHFDYAPPPPYDTFFDSDYEGEVTADHFATSRQVRPGMAPRDLAHVIALYDGEIRFTDEHLGRIVHRLAELDALDDTIVAVTSDHGDEFFEHGGKGHWGTLYEELIRVPLVIRYPPRIPRAMRIREQVRLIDVAPTLLGLASIPAPTGFGMGVGGEIDERDLSAWITGKVPPAPFPRLPAFSRWSPPAGGVDEGGLTSLRSDTFKYIDHDRIDEGPELYNLGSNPEETFNLAELEGSHAASVDHLRSDFQEQVRRWTESWRDGKTMAHSIEIDDEQRRQLFLLGYIQ